MLLRFPRGEHIFVYKRGPKKWFKGLFVRSRDLVAASRDLFVSSRDSVINPGDLLVIFNPTNGININNHHLLPINSTPWSGGGDFWPFALLLTWLALPLILSHLSSVRGTNPNNTNYS